MMTVLIKKALRMSQEYTGWTYFFDYASKLICNVNNFKFL